MKENFFTSMMTEGGKISHKRVISVCVAAVLCWAVVFAMLKASVAPERQTLVNAIMIFILVMSGVATVPQIVSLIRGTPPAKDETKTEENG